jgi:hypothetical protein
MPTMCPATSLLTSPLLRGKGVQNMKLTKQLHLETSIKSTPKCPYRLVLCIYQYYLLKFTSTRPVYITVSLKVTSAIFIDITLLRMLYVLPFCIWVRLIFCPVSLTTEVESYRSRYWTQTGRALCQKNEGSVEIKQSPT